MPSRRPWAFERGTLWVLDLNAPVPVPAEPPPPPTPTPPGATFGEVTPEDAVPLARAMGASDPQVVRERLASGRRCFVANVAGAIAAYGWVSQRSERVGELERTMRMRPDEAYIWECETSPALRGRGLYTGLLRHIITTLRDEGLRRLWIGASLDNVPSIRGFRAAGFQPVLRLVYLRVLHLRYNRLVGDATAASGLVADARQVLSPGRADWPAAEAVRGCPASMARQVDVEER